VALIVDGQGMRVLPRQLKLPAPIAFSGYRGLISRAPERRASVMGTDERD